MSVPQFVRTKDKHRFDRARSLCCTSRSGWTLLTLVTRVSVMWQSRFLPHIYALPVHKRCKVFHVLSQLLHTNRTLKYRHSPGNLFEMRFSQIKLSALYTRIYICLTMSVLVIERAVKKHRERDGGYRAYWIWWNQVFCSSMFPDSG